MSGKLQERHERVPLKPRSLAETRAYEIFQKKHRKRTCAVYLTRSENTGIGYNIWVVCSACDTAKNITDYSVW